MVVQCMKHRSRACSCCRWSYQCNEQCIEEYYPGTEVQTEHCEGLADCKKMLLLAKAGKKDGCMIEGMGCPGGCVAGVGTILPINKAKLAVAKTVKESTTKLPAKDLLEIELP